MMSHNARPSMPTPGPRRPRPWVRRFSPALALAALTLAGCVLPIRVDEGVDALALVGPDAVIYARMGVSEARLLVPYLVPADQAEALDPLFDRTDCLALGIGLRDGAVSSASLEHFDAAFLGDFPFRTASLALSADRSWKREGKGFYNEHAGIRAAIPGPRLLLASSGRLESLIENAKSPGPSPLPPRLTPLASAPIVLWAPEPFSNLVASLIDEEMDVPALGLLVAAEPLAGSGSGDLPLLYEAEVVFLMSDAESARIFRPALRVAWYGIARALFGDEAESALGLNFSLEADVYRASGARFSLSALASALEKIREGSLR